MILILMILFCTFEMIYFNEFGIVAPSGVWIFNLKEEFLQRIQVEVYICSVKIKNEDCVTEKERSAPIS